ncbi:hypothetical protein Ga0100231_024145 [Opitutaceae bacterium TAV4]|nr:hypothetical protein Ga0100231_024145 [Opitutaceae bacterium TAV4]RRK00803.1 hypothetical protein Ga0100230_023720 [Opitutaceae bacterium TAV3]
MARLLHLVTSAFRPALFLAAVIGVSITLSGCVSTQPTQDAAPVVTPQRGDGFNPEPWHYKTP